MDAAAQRQPERRGKAREDRGGRRRQHRQGRRWHRGRLGERGRPGRRRHVVATECLVGQVRALDAGGLRVVPLHARGGQRLGCQWRTRRRVAFLPRTRRRVVHVRRPDALVDGGARECLEHRGAGAARRHPGARRHLAAGGAADGRHEPRAFLQAGRDQRSDRAGVIELCRDRRRAARRCPGPRTQRGWRSSRRGCYGGRRAVVEDGAAQAEVAGTEGLRAATGGRDGRQPSQGHGLQGGLQESRCEGRRQSRCDTRPSPPGGAPRRRRRRCLRDCCRGSRRRGGLGGRGADDAGGGLSRHVPCRREVPAYRMGQG
mmetsp:Transcript_95265/g.274389  ORF Transcript_95265/g.274389 Transcript_95265/m.274389 type:complete len:316 (+) Transcript_95265:129-1076(+)